MANFGQSLYRYAVMLPAMYGAANDWHLRVNAAIDGLTNGGLESVIKSVSNPAPALTEVAPYGLLVLLAMELGASKLFGQPKPQAHQTPIPHR